MKSREFNVPRNMAYVLIAQAVVVISLIFDIPFVRQCSGFLFLTFVPGFLLLRVFGLKEFDIIENILFSIGLSIAFLMLLGVIVNQLGLLNFISNPLSTWSLAVIINVAVCLMCIFSFAKNKNFKVVNINILQRTPAFLSYLILPLLAVIGVLFNTVFNNNLLLIAVLIAIPIVFISILLRPKLSSHYPIFIVAVALVLLLSTTLSTKYLYGDDIQVEYNAFISTKTLSLQTWQWQLGGFVELQSAKSMASVTILPTIYSNLLNIEPNLIFKVIFPLIASLIPLILYQLYRGQFGKNIAFISAIFFTSHYIFFFVLPSHAKPMIAELFFCLLFLILLKRGTTGIGKWGIFTVFVFSLVVSHYAMNYLFMISIGLAWIGVHFFSKKRDNMISSSIIAFVTSFTFFWYSFVSIGPFFEFTRAMRNILNNSIADLLNFTTREGSVQQVIGFATAPSVLHNLGRYVQIITLGLILIGIIPLIIKLKKGKIGSEFALITFLNVGIMFLSIIVPNFTGVGISRLYNFTLIFLSPLFVLGGKTLFMNILNPRIGKKKLDLKEGKKKVYCLILISIVLMVFFLFQTGVVYELAGDPEPSSLALSRYKLENSTFLINENDVFSVSWISAFSSKNIWTWTDAWSIGHVWISYGTISRDMLLWLSNTTQPSIMFNTWHNDSLTIDTRISYVYLSQRSIVDNRIAWDVSTNLYLNYSECPILNDKDALLNKIYSNSGSELYYRVTR